MGKKHGTVEDCIVVQLNELNYIWNNEIFLKTFFSSLLLYNEYIMKTVLNKESK